MSEERSNLIWFVVALIVLVAVLPVLMWGPWAGFMPGMMGMMGYGWGFGFLLPLVFLVLIALGAYFLITALGGASRPRSGNGGRALETLKQRYARGEITREEYLGIKEELDS